MDRTARCLCGLGVLLAVAPRAAAWQDEGSQQAKPKPKTVEELQKEFDDLKKEHQKDLDDLYSEIDDLSDQVADAAKSAQIPQQQTLSVFNPAITAFGNFLYRMDDRPVYVDDDPSAPRVDDRFSLREAEIDLRAPIDPWADGVLITSFGAEVPGEYTTDIEEGYVVLKKLPVLDTAPAGLKVVIGRFRPTFGRFNTIHLHDLPHPTYPEAVRMFLGPEGFNADGISGEFFLPSPSDSDVIDATVQLIDGGSIAVDPNASSSDLSGVAHVKWFRDLSAGHDAEVGASAFTSFGGNQLYGLDATYRWKPFIAGEWKSFLFGVELFQASLNDPSLAARPNGLDVWSQYQLDRNIYVGLRYGRADELTDASQVTRSVGAYVTYYTTEFLRFRVGLEHRSSDVSALNDVDTLMVEVNSVFGGHPAEPYWVNR